MSMMDGKANVIPSLTTKVLGIHEKTESHSYNYFYSSKLKLVVKFNMEIVFKASHYTVTGCPL